MVCSTRFIMQMTPRILHFVVSHRKNCSCKQHVIQHVLYACFSLLIQHAFFVCQTTCFLERITWDLSKDSYLFYCKDSPLTSKCLIVNKLQFAAFCPFISLIFSFKIARKYNGQSCHTNTNWPSFRSYPPSSIKYILIGREDSITITNSISSKDNAKAQQVALFSFSSLSRLFISAFLSFFCVSSHSSFLVNLTQRCQPVKPQKQL